MMARTRGSTMTSVTPMTLQTPTIYVVRHGATAWNEPPERFRSWEDLPLNDDGEAEAERLADYLEENAAVALVITSDLQRAADTGEAIADEVGVPLVETKGLRPWNLGEWTGELVSTYLPKVIACVKGGTCPRGGEPFAAFQDRLLGEMRSICAIAQSRAAEGAVVAVTHTRDVRVIMGWVDAGAQDRVNPRYMTQKDDPLCPGGLLKLTRLNGKWTQEVLSARCNDASAE